MDILYDLVKNIAVISITLGFLQILLPEGTMKSTAHLVFGLIFIAVMINPIVHIVTGVDLNGIDFSDMTITPLEDGDKMTSTDEVYSVAEQTLAMEIKGIIENRYDRIDTQIILSLTDNGISEIQVIIVDNNTDSDSHQKVISYITEMISDDYGVKPNNIIITYKENENG